MLTSAIDVEKSVLMNSGARPVDSDAVDMRIITSVGVISSSGIIDSQNEVGGWPILEENRVKVPLLANPHKDDDMDGYTNIEELIQFYSKKVEFGNDVNWTYEEINDFIDDENLSLNLKNNKTDEINNNNKSSVNINKKNYINNTKFIYLFMTIISVILILAIFFIKNS